MSKRHLASAIAAAAALACALLPATAQADTFPLVGWWPMNEGSGQVVHDWSLHGNNGTLGGNGSPGQFKYIVSKGATSCDNSSYGPYSSANGGVGFYIADTSRYYNSPEAPSRIWDGNWHNVAGTFDGSTVRLYVDGQQVGSGTPAATTINYNLPIQGGMIGNYGGACPNSLTLNGDIDGVKIWSKALSVDSIWNTTKSLFTQAR